MSLLAEVAARADVPVEGVIRVFTRQPVSRRIERRVVEVLDSLDPEQLRAVERLARTGSPDVVPLGSELATTDEPLPAPVAAPDPGTTLTAPDPGTALTAPEGALATGDDELMVELGRLLSELAVGISEIRHDLVGARQDRVDDLAVLVDLMTTGWRGVDRRLGRLERMLTRLEAVREAPQAQLVAPRELDRPAEVVPPPPPSRPVEPAEPVALPPETPRRPLWRRILAPAVPLLFVAVLILALLAFELIGSSDGPSLPPAPESAGQQETQRREEPTTSVSSTTGGPVTEAPPPVTTGTTRTTPTTKTTTATPPPARTTTTATTPAATTTTGKPPPAPTDGITPSRVFAWPASAGTSYYLFRIYRDTKLIHEAHPTTARLVLPPNVKFTEGTYRWSVRPGVGPRSQNQLGAPIVDSRFEVSA